MDEIIDILEDFYYDHQRGIIATIIIIVGIIAACIVFLILYNPIKIRFEGEDSNIIATIPTKLEYKAVAYDKNTEQYPLVWEVSGGTLNQKEGAEVVWDLPKEAGIYTITAKYGEVASKRIVSVMENVLVDSLVEKELTSVDTDLDGLTDEYEVTVSNTDPKNSDSDGDTLTDGNEVILNLNPLLPDTKADGTDDQKREMTYNFTDKYTNVKVEIKGSGNITKTTVDMYKTDSLKDLNGMVSDLYYIFSDSKVTSMNITLKYDKNLVQSKGFNEDLLSIYKLDEGSNKFIKLESTLNKEETSLTAKIKENSKLFIADSSTLKEQITTELMFVIDNSGSMYSKEQIAESSENDVDFKRLSTASKMVDKLKGNYKFGVGKFTFEYTELSGLTEDKELIKNKIDSIKNATEKFTGTYIGEALSGGLKQFPDENKIGARRYLILLTDGKDTETVKGYDKYKIENAIEDAKRKGVKVYTIGLGKEIDEAVLKSIAIETAGEYYYALNADVLDSLFEIIASKINYNLVDNDSDHIDDGILVANTGFITKRNGFSFDNVPLLHELNGCTYGMSLFSKLYYENNLPKNLSQMSVKVPESDKVVTAKGFNISNVGLSGTLYENKIEGLEILSEVPKDFRTGGIQESVLKIKSDYKTKLESVGFKIYNQDYKNSGALFSKYEIFVLDMDSTQYTSAMGTKGKTYFEAITRLDILKYRDETISFKDSSEKAMKMLKETLLDSKTCLLKLNDNYTVNAIRLTESNTNPNQFTIEVYDPNVAGIEKYIECTRNRIYTFETKDETSKSIKENYIYTFTYNGKKVDVKVSIPNIEANV